MDKKLALSMILTMSFLICQGQHNRLPGNTFPDTGNVGIGTTAPTEKLDVAGTVKAKRVVLETTGDRNTPYNSRLDYYKNAQVLTAGYRMPGHPSIPGAESHMFSFYDLHSWRNIGPNDDYLALEIKDRNNQYRFIFDAHKGGGASNGKTKFSIMGKNSDEVFKLADDGLDNVFIHLPKENSRIVIGGYGDYLPEHKFVVKGSAKIEGDILTDANIGIGTHAFSDGSDTYRLSVNGALRAHRVKVYTTWADHVFDPDYNLPALEEVEKYIRKNGHLKEIPSAATVEKNGIELGEINRLLLQKVEELTLYLIGINKELQQLKANVNKDGL